MASMKKRHPKMSRRQRLRAWWSMRFGRSGKQIRVKL